MCFHLRRRPPPRPPSCCSFRAKVGQVPRYASARRRLGSASPGAKPSAARRGFTQASPAAITPGVLDRLLSYSVAPPRIMTTCQVASRVSARPLSLLRTFLLPLRWLELLQPARIRRFSKECTGYGNLGSLRVSLARHPPLHLRLAASQPRFLQQKNSARVLRFQAPVMRQCNSRKSQRQASGYGPQDRIHDSFQRHFMASHRLHPNL